MLAIEDNVKRTGLVIEPVFYDPHASLQAYLDGAQQMLPTKQQIEVITSVERRRRSSHEEKEWLVSACLGPNACVPEIARLAGKMGSTPRQMSSRIHSAQSQNRFGGGTPCSTSSTASCTFSAVSRESSHCIFGIAK
jgi:transposase-like protein